MSNCDSTGISFKSHRCEMFLFLGVLLAAWAGLYLIDLGCREFMHEEGRRALAAREMAERGDYWLPSVLDRVYLNKPPGFPWLIRLAAFFSGGMTEWSVRFPSAAATAMGALSILFFCPQRLSLRARFVAAMLFLCTFMSLEKGRLGEIEAAFTLLVWGSLVFAWQDFQSSRHRWWWLSGLALGAAVLVKGPPAWVFFYGALLCFCWQQGCMKWFLSRGHFIVFFFSVFLFSIWLFAALERAGWSALVETGSREMIGRGGYGIAAFIKEHSSLIGNGFMGLFPGSFFWIAYFWRDRWREKSEDIRVQVFLLCIVLSGWFFFLYYPGARARYLYPLAPATALLGAIVWERALVQPSLHKWITGFYGLVSVMGVVGIGTLFGLTAVIPERIPLFVLLGLLSLILVIAMRIMWRKRFTYSSIFLQLALIWVLSMTGVLAQNSKSLFSLPVRQSAVLLSTFVPDGEPVYTLSWSEFNLFYYVRNPVRYINSLDSLNRDGRSYWVAFRYLDDVRPFDRWEIRDFVVVPLSARDCVYAVKIQ